MRIICKIAFIACAVLASVTLVLTHYIPVEQDGIESFITDFTGEVLATSHNLGKGYSDLYSYLLCDQYNDYPLSWGVNGAYAFVNCFSLLQHQDVRVQEEFEVFNFEVERINLFELKVTYGCLYTINNIRLTELFQATIVKKDGLKIREFRVLNYDTVLDYKHDKMEGF